MKLFKVNQFDNSSDRAYKSFICVAKDECEASQLDPTVSSEDEWANSPKGIQVNFLGRTPLYNNGIIISRSYDV